jgi:RNA polymerase sigma-32 factor
MEQRLGAQEVSLDSRFHMEGDEGRSLTEVLPDDSPSQEEKMGEAEYEEVRKKHLYDALLQLSDRERLIIRRRRLIEDTETLSEIGKDLGITRERVRQLEARALRKLRDFLVDGGLAKIEGELGNLSFAQA